MEIPLADKMACHPGKRLIKAFWYFIIGSEHPSILGGFYMELFLINTQIDSVELSGARQAVISLKLSR